MKKLISTLAVLALVAFVAFKAAVWWFTDQGLRQARAELDGQGVIERGSIHSSVAGLVSLRNASYEDFRLTQPVQIDRLTFDAGSPLPLMLTLFDPDRLPAEWQLAADGVRMTLEPNMFRSWVASADNNEPTLFVPPCGPDPSQRLGSAALLRLGISDIAGEVIIGQRSGALHVEVNTDRTGSLELDWPGARLTVTDPQAVMASTDSALTLTLRDGGLMRSVAAYCSREMDLTGSQWSARAGDLLQQQLSAQGYQASEQLLALYRRWLSEGGELTLTLDPSDATFGVPVQGSGSDQAALRVLYNGAVVPEVFLLPAAEDATDIAENESDEATQAAVPAGTSGWRARALDSAAQWQGHQVRVTLRNGRVVEGRLDGVTDADLDVARPVDGGEVVYPLAQSAVTGFEVWQRGDDTPAR